MASRGYWPSLVTMLRRVCTYIARYRQTIIDKLGDDAAAALDAIVLACDVFIALTPDHEGD